MLPASCLGPLLLLLLATALGVRSKYVEGHLKTAEDWAFVARFCFLSGSGRYEYLIEYEKKYGELKLLLYYDDRSQWPAVYKTDKTCSEKLSVLNVQDNQIVTLSPRSPYNIYSGCLLRTPSTKDNDAPAKELGTVLKSVPGDSRSTPDDDAMYYDQFLKTSTTEDPVPMDRTNASDFDVSTEDGNLPARPGSVEFNGLENSTDYRILVEELFRNSDTSDATGNGTRVRRGTRFDKQLIVSCSNFGSFTSSRERWWYIAVSNCGSGKGLDVRYRFRMTNGQPGDFWHEHFSADEMYIPPILLAESLAYTMLLVAVFLCAIELKSRHLYHCTYRLFTLSVLLQWFGILLLSVTWAKYAVSGIGPFPNFGGVFTSASEISFFLLLLLMAKGYTITRARLKTCATVKITVFINLYAVVYITLYIYQAEAFDPGEVLNLYESPAGFGLAGLRCVGWGFFIYSSAATIRKFTEKAPFYYPFTLLGSMWIMSGPTLTLLGVNVLDPWVRESVMHGALGTVAFAGHLTFLWLTWPSRANKSFPYHVRTNHVGISAADDEVTYPKHTYEPAPPDTGVIIPLSRNTAAMNGAYDHYLRERDLYHTGSTPLSYVSFPTTRPVQQQQQQRSTSGEDNQSATGNEHLINSPTSTVGPVPRQPAFDAGDTLVDSGHPSLEVSITPNNNNNNDDNDENFKKDQQPEQPEIVGKSNPYNPFLAGGGHADERRPNKIILPSLDLGGGGGTIGSPLSRKNGEEPSSTVPKHLFAAKKEPA